LQIGLRQRRTDLICAESKNFGLTNKWSFSYVNEIFTNALKKAGRKILPIECVVITTPNVSRIDGIFCRLGAEHFINFVTERDI
jgi:hypothetical protein